MSKTFWTCTHCNEEVESQFEVCWNCQRDRTGLVPPNFSDLEIEDRAEKTFLNAKTSDKYCLACRKKDFRDQPQVLTVFACGADGS